MRSTLVCICLHPIHWKPNYRYVNKTEWLPRDNSLVDINGLLYRQTVQLAVEMCYRFNKQDARFSFLFFVRRPAFVSVYGVPSSKSICITWNSEAYACESVVKLLWKVDWFNEYDTRRHSLWIYTREIPEIRYRTWKFRI